MKNDNKQVTSNNWKVSGDNMQVSGIK